MEITRGIIRGAQKVVIYGPEGIGKSTLAAQFPKPLFIDTEGGTKHMDVARLPKPTSWVMLGRQLAWVKQHPDCCDTLIIDTVDWAEQLCSAHVIAKNGMASIESFGYGKGYTYIAEEFGHLLNALNDIIDLGINAVLVAHAYMRKFDEPNETGQYDRWELKLSKKAAPMVKEWSDLLLFCNYKVHVVNIDGQGAAKGKNKVQGGKRVMYTTHHPCWDAKNRHDLPPVIDLDYKEIARCIPVRGSSAPEPVAALSARSDDDFPGPIGQEVILDETPAAAPAAVPAPAAVAPPPPPPAETKAASPIIPQALADLMADAGITLAQIQQAVAMRGIYPANTPFDAYDPGFVQGVLIGAWPKMMAFMIENNIVAKGA